MAYKLLDSNGNYMNINGMHKGTIVSPYVYNGMELYNENAIASNRYAFYSTYRRVRIGTTYHYPSGTTKYYSTVAYEATEVAITGRYSTSVYKDYEVYKDGNLVASGSFTGQATDIYVCEKNANTSIIISGEWDYTNSKFIYNITTNATIERSNSYYFNNGIVKTSTFVSGTINDQNADTTNNVPRKIELPSQEEFVHGSIPEDSIILSIGNPSFRFTFTMTISGFTYDAWLRTAYNATAINPSTLPGSAVTSVTNLTSASTKSSTVHGASRFGKTYYLYIRPSGGSGTYTGASSFLTVSCVITATVKYRYFDEVHTAIVNITRTNAYTLPAYSLAQVQAMLPSYGTSTISSFRYHRTVKNNASSGSYTYYRIMEGTTVKYGPYSLALGSTTTGYFTYTANMPSTLVLQRSNASDGTFSNGSDSYISYLNEEGAQYLEIFYTWTPE